MGQRYGSTGGSDIEGLKKDKKGTENRNGLGEIKGVKTMSREMPEPPEPFVYSDNGSLDLEKQGKNGFSVWVGFQHSDRGRQPVNEAKMDRFSRTTAVQQFLDTINNKYGTDFQPKDVEVENKWKTTDFFRLFLPVSSASENSLASETLKKETGSKHSMSGHLTANDYDKVENGGHVMFVKNGEGAFNTVTRVGGNWMSETPDGGKKVISSQELYDLVQQYDNKDGYGINAALSFSGPLDEDSKKQGGEKFSRVNLPDIPNAHKVNLTKYLSAKRKKAVDDAWEKAKFDSLPREKAGVFQEGYNKLREQFNNNFDDMSKSERAELLYKILKMKNAMERK